MHILVIIIGSFRLALGRDCGPILLGIYSIFSASGGRESVTEFLIINLRFFVLVQLALYVEYPPFDY